MDFLALKKKIKDFEEKFEEENGYKVGRPISNINFVRTKATQRYHFNVITL